MVQAPAEGPSSIESEAERGEAEVEAEAEFLRPSRLASCQPQNHHQSLPYGKHHTLLMIHASLESTRISAAAHSFCCGRMIRGEYVRERINEYQLPFLFAFPCFYLASPCLRKLRHSAPSRIILHRHYPVRRQQSGPRLILVLY